VTRPPLETAMWRFNYVLSSTTKARITVPVTYHIPAAAPDPLHPDHRAGGRSGVGLRHPTTIDPKPR
jgi:hypothetical protein